MAAKGGECIMVIIILKRNTAGGDAYLHHLARYLKYDRKTKGIRTDFVDLWGFGVDGADPELAYEQMKRTREYFGKEQYNPLLHYIVSFDLTVQDAFMASVRAEKIAAYFKGNHQVLWGLHRKKREYSLYHVHYLVNAVNYRNGRMIDSYRPEIARFAMYVKDVTHCAVHYGMAGFREDV